MVTHFPTLQLPFLEAIKSDPVSTQGLQMHLHW